jgi:hypothetical protein
MLERSFRDFEAAQEEIQILGVRRTVSARVDARRFCVGFAFDLQRIAIRARRNGSDFALLLTTDVGRFAATFGAKFGDVRSTSAR